MKSLYTIKSEQIVKTEINDNSVIEYVKRSIFSVMLENETELRHWIINHLNLSDNITYTKYESEESK